MASNGIDFEELLEIVKLVEASPEISVFRLKHGNVELEIEKQSEAMPGDSALDTVPEAQSAGRPQAAVPATAESRPRASEAPKVAVHAEGAFVVKSPMVGTFYSAPEPGAKAFVEIGQRVSAHTTVCIIEIMKLMNSISAGRAGVVVQVLAGNAELVEYGQSLFVIQPE